MIAVAMAKCECNKVFLPFNKPVHPVVGKDNVILDPCHECRGKGRRKQNKKLSVKIPPGVDTGDRIRLSGEGEAGESGAPAGDLYVQINVHATCHF